MNSVPTQLPMMMARTDQNSDAPSLMLIRPTASVAICAFGMHHNRPRCQTLPCRSFSGTYSGERRPLGRPPAAGELPSADSDVISPRGQLLTSGLSNLAPLPVHNVDMRDGSGHPAARSGQSLWQERQVQFSRGHWRREEGAVRSAGWWESVTVTWSPTPAPGRSPAPLGRALAAAADAIAPAIVELAAATTARLIERQRRSRPALPPPRRRMPPMARALPRPDRTS